MSRHAVREAGRRQIPLDTGQAVLDRPEQIVPIRHPLVAYRSRWTDASGRVSLVRAIVSLESAPGVALTVYRTSKIAKYWQRR